MSTPDLFATLARTPHTEPITDGAVVLRAFVADETVVLRAVEAIAMRAPFRHLETPGGFRMSVAMTNCGGVGWVSDRSGYRYASTDPTTGECWPAMPTIFQNLAESAAAAGGFAGFHPDACLVNRYAPGARLSMHQDRDEGNYDWPIVSVSLGLPAVFLFGGLRRSERPRRIRLESGDVVVWGGAMRLAYHGVAALADGEHPLTGRRRINLTFRNAR